MAEKTYSGVGFRVDKKSNDQIAKEARERQEYLQGMAKKVYRSAVGKKLSGRDLSTNPDGRNPPLPVPRPKSDSKKADSKKADSKKADAPKPTSRPERAPKLEGNRKVGAAPKPNSAREGKERAARAEERRAGSGSSSGKNFPAGKPDNSRTSGSRDSKGSLGYRIARALGDTRSESQMVADRKATEKMERDRGR